MLAALAALDERWQARMVEVDDAAWADAWRAYATPVRAGDRIVVVPAWLPAPAPADLPSDPVVVRLDPGRAFGSGTHPSTRLVLAALERLIGGGERVLDVGSGSGVLAVAAGLLGASAVVAVDVDPEAVRVTGDNARRNGVAGIVEARAGDIGAAGAEAFDVIAVNIGAAAIVEAAGDLVPLLRPGGHLVLAGFVADAAPRVRDAFGDLELVDEPSDGEWAALTLRTRAQ